MQTDLISKLIEEMEQRIGHLNYERSKEDLPPLSRPTITLLGQFALFADPIARQELDLRSTRDLDALLEGDWIVRSVLKESLNSQGLEYDDLSSEIWMPEEAICTVIHESSQLLLKAYDPLSVIVSKAIKAPARNRFLVAQAILLYGERLIELITKYGGDLEFFVSNNEKK